MSVWIRKGLFFMDNDQYNDSGNGSDNRMDDSYNGNNYAGNGGNNYNGNNYAGTDGNNYNGNNYAGNDGNNYNGNNYNGNYNGGYNNGGYNPYQPQGNNRIDEGRPFGIAAMVLGIISVVFSCCCYALSIVTGIAAIVLGVVSLKKGTAGKGFAIAGIITGSVGIFFAVVMFIFEVYLRQSGLYQQLMDMYLNSDSSSDFWKDYMK